MFAGIELTSSIELDMNNRKDDTRTEMKGFDMHIEVGVVWLIYEGFCVKLALWLIISGDQQQIHNLSRRPENRDRICQVGRNAKSHLYV